MSSHAHKVRIFRRSTGSRLAAPSLEEKVRNHLRAGVIEMLAQLDHEHVKLTFLNEPFLDRRVADVPNEIKKDAAAIVAVGVLIRIAPPTSSRIVPATSPISNSGRQPA